MPHSRDARHPGCLTQPKFDTQRGSCPKRERTHVQLIGALGTRNTPRSGQGSASTRSFGKLTSSPARLFLGRYECASGTLPPPSLDSLTQTQTTLAQLTGSMNAMDPPCVKLPHRGQHFIHRLNISHMTNSQEPNDATVILPTPTKPGEIRANIESSPDATRRDTRRNWSSPTNHAVRS